MSDYLHRLQIPPGKARYTLCEAVTATSLAMHPPPSGDDEAVITAIDKTVIRDGDLLRRSRPVELNEDDWRLLRIIWSRLDHPVFPMPASEWKEYLAAFDASKNRPLKWALCVTQRNPDLQADLRRNITLVAHAGELKGHIVGGRLMPHNAMTGARTISDDVPISEDWILTIPQFKIFCDLLLIEAIESQAPPTAPLKPAAIDTAEIVTITITEAGHVTTIRQTRAEHASDLAEKMERQSKGRYTVCEAAEIFSAANSFDAADFRIDRLLPAIASKALELLDPKDNGPVVDRPCRDTYDWLTSENIKKWIRDKELDYLWPAVPTPPTVAPVNTQPAPARAEPENSTHWKMRVQVGAAEHWRTLRQCGANPTVASIVDHMAKWCKTNSVLTDGGINPKASYLRTHVLGGKHWTPPR